MFKRILIPLDGSALGEQVLPFAKMFAAQFHSSVILCQAVEFIQQPPVDLAGAAYGIEEQMEFLRWSAVAYLERIQRDFAEAGVHVEYQTQCGSPATAILELAQHAQVDLIAMATHGRTGLAREVFGSMADKVLRGATQPMLLVRARAEPTALALLNRILVPVDGSELAERALVPAMFLAKAFGAEILLFRAGGNWTHMVEGYPPGPSTFLVEDQIRQAAEEYLEQKKWEIEQQGVRVHSETHSGPAAECILEAVQKHRADLIIMSSHGRSGVQRWVMGSIADRVLHASTIPILLIRSRALTE